MKQYHICCTTDANYITPCIVMLLSLCRTNPQVAWTAHVCVWNVPEDYKAKMTSALSGHNIKIKFYKIEASKLAGVKIRKKIPLPPVAYYRIFLADILPDDIDRILYLDCDLMVMRNIDGIFDTDISDYALAAVEDQLSLTEEHRRQLDFLPNTRYFNSGVMLINLKYWREKDVSKYLLAFSQMERQVFFHDQDALNYVFKNNWKRLPPQYNRFYPSYYPRSRFRSKQEIEEFENPAVLHFCWYIKPWHKVKWWPSKYNQYLHIYYTYAKEIPDGIPQPLSNLKCSRYISFYLRLLHCSTMRVLFKYKYI